MTRFILRWVTVLVLLLGLVPLQAASNSKRPTAPAPTLLLTSRVPATHAVAKAAKLRAKTTGCVNSQEVVKAEAKAKKMARSSGKALGNGFARVTAYWACDGDYYTRHHISSTGIRLHNGHCAVDPTVIPYGSVVQIDGLGTYLAVDTGTAVVSRRAARKSGHNHDERHALVVDVYFESRSAGEHFAANGPKFASITWYTPGTETASDPQPMHGLVAFNDASRSKAL
jgi:3D (Asp-Asp-Asp) domain-containing protein